MKKKALSFALFSALAAGLAVGIVLGKGHPYGEAEREKHLHPEMRRPSKTSIRRRLAELERKIESAVDETENLKRQLRTIEQREK